MMTTYINLRSPAGIAPQLFTHDSADPTPRMHMLTGDTIARATANRDVLLGIHGFNVGFERGLALLGGLDAAMTLPANARFLAVLWPGDFWIPVVNYPFEASVAVRCGRQLADFCDRVLTRVRSLSIVSHSLGGRVALEAVRTMRRHRTSAMCLAASAVDRDCLTSQYADALARCDRTYVLSSVEDMVLRFAYPAGDFLSDVFLGDTDNPFGGALGLRGPRPDAGARVTPSPIPASSRCGHNDYLVRPAIRTEVARYVVRALAGAPQSWP